MAIGAAVVEKRKIDSIPSPPLPCALSQHSKRREELEGNQVQRALRREQQEESGPASERERREKSKRKERQPSDLRSKSERRSSLHFLSLSFFVSRLEQTISPSLVHHDALPLHPSDASQHSRAIKNTTWRI